MGSVQSTGITEVLGRNIMVGLLIHLLALDRVLQPRMEKLQFRQVLATRRKNRNPTDRQPPSDSHSVEVRRDQGGQTPTAAPAPASPTGCA